MTYEETVAKVKKEFGAADASKYEGHLAIQINITGEGEGAFYTEINEGKLSIEPYDYKDYDAMFTATGDDIINIFGGKLSANDALNSGKLGIDGDYSKALSIQPVIDENVKPVKTARKKTSAKTSKSAAKTEVKVEMTEEVKKACATKKTASKTSKSTKAVDKTASKTASKAVKETSVKAPKTAKSSAKKG